jgi:hypothetical protein
MAGTDHQGPKREGSERNASGVELGQSGVEYSVRVAVVCEPGTSKRRAEQIARSIQKYAEARPSVSHAYEVLVYDEPEGGDE